MPKIFVAKALGWKAESPAASGWPKRFRPSAMVVENSMTRPGTARPSPRSNCMHMRRTSTSCRTSSRRARFITSFHAVSPSVPGRMRKLPVRNEAVVP